VAGALSIAAGEYVSISSQADTERADLVLEPTELAADPAAEQRELTAIYVRRGLDPALAQTAARQLITPMRSALALDSSAEISALLLKYQHHNVSKYAQNRRCAPSGA
jgi:VIT1/CCC1 family predicted Fe2+/Mn2+ transporter